MQKNLMCKNILQVTLSMVLVIVILVGAYVMQHQNKLEIKPITSMAINQIPAFPGAQGFGSTTVGGRGGEVIAVTNLNDSGPGSFRAAVSATVPRIVIFKVGGTINLNSTIEIRNPFLTIAGQTAPGGGILIRGPNSPGSVNGGLSTIVVNTHDVIIRGLRVRGVNRAAIGLYPYPETERRVNNIIIDHNSLSWSLDTILDSWYDPYNVTYSWNILSEPVGTDHNYALLVGGRGDCENTANGQVAAANFSIHHNLIAHSRDRNPIIKQQVDHPEIINNVIYNYDYYSIKTFSEAAVIGNQIIPGINTRNPDSAAVFVENRGECPSLRSGSVYVARNIGPGRLSDSGEEWNIVNGGFSSYGTRSIPSWLSGITVDNVSNIKSIVLSGAGALKPNRDAVDQRIISEVNNGTGSFVSNSSSLVWPNIASGTYPTDSDSDGMPNSWEQARGLNSNVNDSSLDRDGDGYTNIEEYINSFFTEIQSVTQTPVPTESFKQGDVNRDEVVNILDFQLLSNTFGKSQGQIGYNSSADFNNDNVINILDFQILSNNFGE